MSQIGVGRARRVVASATHLLPAIGLGDPAIHARQRRLLGRAATVRLTILDIGVAALAIGLPLSLEPLITGGPPSSCSVSVRPPSCSDLR